MLFNSYEFIFLFLPIVFTGMFLIARFNHRLAALWLGLSSLTFYAVWDTGFVLLLLASICFNYGAGYFIGVRIFSKQQISAKRTLIAAVTANLSLLAYFKYSNFFIESANAFLGLPIGTLNIILPLGISFFTFTQIAYLVDVYKGVAREYNFIHYLLFVSYFPHLIAGPIIHHKQIMPQFRDSGTYRIHLDNVAVGLTIFILGLAKKVLIADNLALYATPVFAAADLGSNIMFFEAWIGALAYTLQLYFDFSAYCDMAIGISLMLNIRLPMNFNSPYKAASIIDFWRRWHMTLSAFLRDYLYIPLGGNRKGSSRRYMNLIATMLLGALWHGAGWTFVAWGGLHAFYLMLNHGWRALKYRLGWSNGGEIARLASVLFTFIAVVIAWVFFRAETFAGALIILAGMFGLNGISLPSMLEHISGFTALNSHMIYFNGITPATNISITKSLLFIISGLGIVWLLPNMRESFSAYKSTWEDLSGKLPCYTPETNLSSLFIWKPDVILYWGVAILFVVSLLSMNQVSEFLYFQF